MVLIVFSTHLGIEYTDVDRFFPRFWNDKEKCLYDYIDGDFSSRDIRPNQLYAMGLPFKVLDEDKFAAVIQVVQKHLLTPRGLRSLSPLHPDYHATYHGIITYRDSAYHQGTVWSHLIGIYTDALFATLREEGRDEAMLILNGFFRHLDEAGLGSVSEVFDGNAPHFPGGCIAQAWSVAEVLRCLDKTNAIQRSSALSAAGAARLSDGES